MRLALCNEVVRERPFAAQCDLAAALGYDGLELAPFTLGDAPHLLPATARTALRRALADAGIGLSGLHWLLVAPAGLSITEAAAAPYTQDVIERLIDLCAELGGTRMVHGSPAQRRLPGGETSQARRTAEALLTAVAERAGRAGIVYCLEPLAPPDANWVNTLAEAAAVLRNIGHPALRTMLDTSAAGNAETETPAALVARWMPTGLLAHVHVNDPNRRGPGEGAMRFGPMLEALRAEAYDGWIGVEPFVYIPDGPTCAARAVGYLRALLEPRE